MGWLSHGTTEHMGRLNPDGSLQMSPKAGLAAPGTPGELVQVQHRPPAQLGPKVWGMHVYLFRGQL